MSDQSLPVQDSLKKNERAVAVVTTLLSSAIGERDVSTCISRACERLLFLLSAEDLDSMSDIVDEENESDEKRVNTRRRIKMKIRSVSRSILEDGARRIITEALADSLTPSDCGPSDQTSTLPIRRKIDRLLAQSLLNCFGHHSCNCSCPEGRPAAKDDHNDVNAGSLTLLAYNPMEFSKSPLHHAAFGGNTEATEYLLNVAHFLREVDSALECSLRCGTLLNSDGIDEHTAALSSSSLVVRDGEVGETPAGEMRARLNNPPPDERLGALGKKKGHITKFINNALLVSADEGEVHNVRALVEAFNADINYKPHGGGHRALHLAAANGHEDVVLFLLSIFDKGLRAAHLSLCSMEKAVGIASSDNWAFEGEGKKRQLDVLTAEGGHGMLPIHVAAMTGRQDMIRVLALAFARASMSANEHADAERELERGSISDMCRPPSLSFASRSVKKAVSTGYGPYRLTAMHTAAAYGRVEAVKVLAELGADVNTETVCACGVANEAHVAAQAPHSSSPLCYATALQLAVRSAIEDLETLTDSSPDDSILKEEDGGVDLSSSSVEKATDTKDDREAMAEYPSSWIAKWSAVIAALVELGADLSQLDAGKYRALGVLIPSAL